MRLRLRASLGCVVLCSVFGSVQGTAQEAAPAPADAKPKADIIFMHANVYTGVPDNTPFSSILREEAIAVRGDRIQAVGQDR